MTLMHLNRTMPRLRLDNSDTPELYRELFPYTKISRVPFDDTIAMPRPAERMFITDTTFRDGQQARPPYTVKQIVHIFDMLHRLGGQSGLIRASEFFLYSDKDRRAVEACQAKDYKFPEVTGWIRANANDLKLVKSMGLKETGLLTSVSDYHIHLKLGKDRKAAMESYLAVVDQALEWGIVPRCHFEDLTRADIFGFCLPFAQALMERSRQAGMPVKIRLCDTMGYGVPYPGAALPRSVSKLVRAFTDEAQVPSEWLEWHGHNDFHKVLVNASTAWLSGCSGANCTLLGFGERTGNAPLEAMVVEYISLTGEDDVANTQVISEIAAYFEDELEYAIPANYPFVGRDFNATSAGIHVDGLAKNEEIYNIFDTQKILGRSVPIIITDKSGKAGVSYWINHNMGLEGDDAVDKRHPAVDKIYNRIMEAYESGRNTSFSNQEMRALVKRYMPELFTSEFDHLKKLAHSLSAQLILKLSEEKCLREMDPERSYARMAKFLGEYPFIQFLYLVDTEGLLVTRKVSDPADRERFSTMQVGVDLSNREWFQKPMQNGKFHVTDFYTSQFTGKLCLTVSAPVANERDEIVGVIGADIRFEELMRRQGDLEDEQDLVELD
ncbi:Citrate (Re)-synthase [Fundidesulfovibrio magnetotacticus]|uniref:Citrate (Re)-synthase n=1 Tax=Fundidesulfovibrio magnetotacticus TaxID=2730080 RepID=A0A6V8LUJ1_9BACT|nr:cache domain-containing protein [Fundidesulfovibrio magnetotacticus]GFK94620.1 Citrate (Re)-synthase [Fundidesulfovibrio magnetotacticus]